jgi:hypothetical protein
MGDFTKLVRGRAQVNIDVSGTLTDIGHTLGGVDGEIGATIYHWNKTDETGETELDPVRNGAEPDFITIRYAEETYANLQRAVDGMTLITDATDPAKKRLDRRVSAGGAPTSYKFVIKPIDPATGAPVVSKEKWLTIPQAVPVSGVPFSYKSGEQRVYEVRYRAVVVQLSSGAFRSFFFGDESAVAA